MRVNWRGNSVHVDNLCSSLFVPSLFLLLCVCVCVPLPWTEGSRWCRLGGIAGKTKKGDRRYIEKCIAWPSLLDVLRVSKPIRGLHALQQLRADVLRHLLTFSTFLFFFFLLSRRQSQLGQWDTLSQVQGQVHLACYLLVVVSFFPFSSFFSACAKSTESCRVVLALCCQTAKQLGSIIHYRLCGFARFCKLFNQKRKKKRQKRSSTSSLNNSKSCWQQQ